MEKLYEVIEKLVEQFTFVPKIEYQSFIFTTEGSLIRKW